MSRGRAPTGPEGGAAGPDAWLARLSRSLRAGGVACSVPETLAARRALDALDLSDALDVYFGLRAVFTSKPGDLPAFDRCFWAAWGHRQRGEVDVEPQPPAEGRTPSADGTPRRREPGEPSVVERLRGARDGLGPPPEGEGDADEENGGERVERSIFSPVERLAERSFATLDRAEARAVERAMDGLVLRLATRRSRRLRSTSGRGRPDLRRSFRGALRSHGELLRLARRARRRDRPRVVLLCDVSGSMERYGRFLLRFLLSAVRHRDVECYVFATRLTRLEPGRGADAAGRALEALGARVRDWAGGTRLGDCLETFLHEHGRRVLDRRTVVVILSDGLDRGDPARLERAMRGIHRRARRVIWLNPLLESPGYRPEARGMKAALPHVDHFAPCHSLASLRALADLVRL